SGRDSVGPSSVALDQPEIRPRYGRLRAINADGGCFRVSVPRNGAEINHESTRVRRHEKEDYLVFLFVSSYSRAFVNRILSCSRDSMIAADLRAVVHRALALAPLPTLRSQQTAHNMVRDGVAHRRQ